MKYQVLLTEPISPAGVGMLEKEVAVVIAPSPSDADLLPLVGKADALLIRSTTLSRAVMDAGINLKVIGRHGIGIDNIDMAAATRLGIQVVNTPGANTNAVAEHTLWAIMHCAKNFNRAEKALREGKFASAGSLPGLVQKMGYSTLELKAKGLGLVGFGRIARRLAELARGLQMDIKAFDPLVDDEAFQALAVRRVFSLEEAIRDADFVSLHVPHMKETHHLIGEKQLALMKRGAFLINTSRGGIVDEAALLHALREGEIAGAALDVFEQEPPPADLPFFGLDNVLVTPHMAAMTDLALVNMAVDVSRGILDALAGKKPMYLANPEVWEKRRR
ncbi:MAG: (S)-sulfolactate dehydrogenase [Syntrophaceae bacterium PtaU1.Bin231]|nr:MAG: (S)-sulfolactate dehydrogenase [Syntrophaceae bacterium PtaU1.Bin231]